jgi:RND family efflux transporter MFP subunit
MIYRFFPARYRIVPRDFPGSSGAVSTALGTAFARNKKRVPRMSRQSLTTAFMVCALALSACTDPAPVPPSAVDRGVPVIVEPLRFEPARTRAEAVGTSRASLSAELYPASSGEVTGVNFEPGQFVRKGDVLVELDRRKETLAVEQAALQLEDAERLYDRYRRSAGSGAVLPTALDAARTAAELARVELRRARVALDDRTITAPFDGHVDSTDIDRGDRVTPETLITTLDDRSQLLVRFEVPELFISELVPGKDVMLETWGVPGPRVAGEIVDVGSRIDPQTRTFGVRARVDNTDDLLRPGMSFRVETDVRGEMYAAIAEAAVQWGTEGAYIWSVSDGTAVRKPVRIIERREGRVLVDGDLVSGDIIVVEGVQRMREGLEVSYDMPRFADERLSQPAGAETDVDDSPAVVLN